MKKCWFWKNLVSRVQNPLIKPGCISVHPRLDLDSRSAGQVQKEEGNISGDRLASLTFWNIKSLTKMKLFCIFFFKYSETRKNWCTFQVTELRCGEVRWFYQEPKTTSWVPFIGHDSLILEIKYRAVKKLELDEQTTCYISANDVIRQEAVVLNGLYRFESSSILYGKFL